MISALLTGFVGNLHRKVNRNCPWHAMGMQTDYSTKERVGKARSPVCSQALASSMITSDAFSLIMYTAHAMKDPGIRGNTEASTTRRLRAPCTLNRESTTVVGSPAGPILLVPHA